MNDEIKEILEDIKRLIEEDETPENMKKYVGGTFNINELKILLDYITNLQVIESEYSSLLSENAELQQENDRLNNVINELEKELELEKNDYGRNLDIQTHNIDSEFIRGNSWEADYILDKLKELKENNNE